MTWIATIDSRTKFVIQALRRESIATFDYRNFQHLIFKLAGEFAYDQVPLVLEALPITLSFI